MIPDTTNEWPGAEILPEQGLWSGRLILFDSLPSTNTWTKAHLNSLHAGDVVAAWRQTAGRGRFSRSWITPAGGNIALSLVLDKPAQPEQALSLGQTAALAVARLLESLGIRTQLKWPNDVLVQSRKISGILAEAASASDKIVIGIGLNTTISREELKANGLEEQATSIFLELGRQVEAEQVLSQLLSSIHETLAEKQKQGNRYLARAWKIRDALLGAEIEIIVGEESWRGRYQGMDDLGRLMIQFSGGEDRTFWSGEVVKVRRGKN